MNDFFPKMFFNKVLYMIDNQKSNEYCNITNEKNVDEITEFQDITNQILMMKLLI
jgi:hypothetical protein